MSPYATKDEFDFFAAADRIDSSFLAEAAQMAAVAVVVACLLYIASSFGTVSTSGCAVHALPPQLWPVDQGVDDADYLALPASPAHAPQESALALAVPIHTANAKAIPIATINTNVLSRSWQVSSDSHLSSLGESPFTQQ